MVKISRILRKCLPIPAAIAAWCISAYLTLLFDEWFKFIFCPGDLLGGSICYGEGWDLWPTWIVSGGAIFSALMSVWAAALAAAENRSLVALWTFLVGSLLALFLGLVTNYVFPALLAIIAGGFAYWVVDKICEKANR